MGQALRCVRINPRMKYCAVIRSGDQRARIVVMGPRAWTINARPLVGLSGRQGSTRALIDAGITRPTTTRRLLFGNSDHGLSLTRDAHSATTTRCHSTQWNCLPGIFDTPALPRASYCRPQTVARYCLTRYPRRCYTPALRAITCGSSRRSFCDTAESP